MKAAGFCYGETAIGPVVAPRGWGFVLASNGAQVTSADYEKLVSKNFSKLNGLIAHRLGRKWIGYRFAKP